MNLMLDAVHVSFLFSQPLFGCWFHCTFHLWYLTAAEGIMLYHGHLTAFILLSYFLELSRSNAYITIIYERYLRSMTETRVEGIKKEEGFCYIWTFFFHYFFGFVQMYQESLTGTFYGPLYGSLFINIFNSGPYSFLFPCISYVFHSKVLSY
jgi:hypothetical protein